jgi:hypothetical protein
MIEATLGKAPQLLTPATIEACVMTQHGEESKGTHGG